ncbi:MAG TPA: isoprenylcysteine carboxylmethyltransferase family protein [bacterium]|nr:isoprenylcysteine carboxylmethyltransferase family protein [bacterium]
MWRRPDRAHTAGPLLASMWNIPSLLLLHLLAGRFGWWQFDVDGGVFLNFPVDLYLGWILLWGAIPALAFPRMHLALVTALMVGIDLILMPVSRPIVHLGGTWLVGEAVGVALCLIPAQLLARWTGDGSRLAARAVLQVLAFGGLMLGVLPAAIVEMTGGSWRPLLDRPVWQTALGVQIMAVPAILGASAVQEFVERGDGTPVPYDPPTRLVTSGVYAYVANPMQVAMALVLILWGSLLQSVWVAGAAFMGIVYSAGVAAWNEGEDLTARYGGAWRIYRRAVRRWWPRWRPWYPPAGPGASESVARLYVAETCGPCSSVARWFEARRPAGLMLVAAEDHPTRDLHRLTYQSSDGRSTDGVSALARGLEHLHFGWAIIGCTMRLPLVCSVLQLIVDATGGGPRVITRRAAGGHARRSGGGIFRVKPE